jgi:hypothetical protein
MTRSAASQTRTRHDQDVTSALHEIREMLDERLQPQRKPWWKPRGWMAWIVVLLVSLCFLDFPSESRTKADLVVFNGADIAIVKSPQPELNIGENKLSPNFWRVPDLPTNVDVFPLWEVSLYHQGLRYRHSAIRAVRHGNETVIDFLSPPIRIDGPTRMVFTPIFDESKGEEKLMASKVLQTHELTVSGDQRRYPLGQVINYKTDDGQLLIEMKPRIGWQRFI